MRCMADVTTPDHHSALGTSSEWVQVFRARRVWDLDEAAIRSWVTNNDVFFKMVQQFVPASGSVLELGSGPGRHALGHASLGFDVLGLDLSEEIVAQAQRNARAVETAGWRAEFAVGNMFELEEISARRRCDAITHGGVMEHFESADQIRAALEYQLRHAPAVIFDVPINTPKNRALFTRDDIFRQMWTAEQWLQDVLAGLPVAKAAVDPHPLGNMTDDLVVALAV
jgi:2-polyprenyl-3-methyl-5-hydroxy-6-metoxy-1,4-benzoquinol methylase